MTSIIKLEALSGVNDELAPLCFVLQVDEFHFLLDCGWDEQFSTQYLEHLRVRIPHIDAVLLSYPDPLHLGALPVLVGKMGLSCPIYATVPVYKMGQMFCYDWFQSHQNQEDFTIFSLDDVDAAFDKIQQVKYNQQVSLKGRGHGLQITPLAAGHMLGGTIWKITKLGEEEIIYAVDFNHKKERHLNGCTFEGVQRPNLLITDAYNASYQQPRRKQRDEQLLTQILQTVRQSGNVLIVLDTAGRVLELAQLLDQLWHNQDAGLITYSLALINNVAYNVVEFAKSQVEWMSDKVLRSFEEGRYNPFQFRHIHICHSMVELKKLRQPMVVLAGQYDMEAGFARELFLEWCINSKNTVILTQRSPSGTLAKRLQDMANIVTTQGGAAAPAPTSFASTRQIIVEVKKRVRIEGYELDEYWRQKRKTEQDAARARFENQRKNQQIHSIDSSESEDDDDTPTILSVQDVKPSLKDLHRYDVMLRMQHHSRSSFFKQTRKHYPMFPFSEIKIRWDDYGQVIRPQDYMIAEPQLPNVIGGEIRIDDDENRTAAAAGEARGGIINGVSASEAVPTKCVKHVQKMDVLCNIQYIDFEGRSDGESVKNLLKQIRPKQLVVVHGNQEATAHLAEFAKTIIQGKVFTPKLLETVDATIESHIYQVTLTDQLMNSLEFQPLKDSELAWVDAKVTLRGQQPCLDLIGTHSDVPPHQAVFVNDPKLSDLKQLLMLNGFQAEFSSGVLYVNSVVAIRRNAAGKFQMEGTTCEDYYKIRDMLYKQFAIV